MRYEICGFIVDLKSLTEMQKGPVTPDAVRANIFTPVQFSCFFFYNLDIFTHYYCFFAHVCQFLLTLLFFVIFFKFSHLFFPDFLMLLIFFHVCLLFELRVFVRAFFKRFATLSHQQACQTILTSLYNIRHHRTIFTLMFEKVTLHSKLSQNIKCCQFFLSLALFCWCSILY